MHRLLFDNNVSHRILPKIENIFKNSTHVMLEKLDRASDIAVWNFAKDGNYIIITKDSDFNDLAILKGTPPKIIWLKIGNCSVDAIGKALEENQKIIKIFLEEENNSILEI